MRGLLRAPSVMLFVCGALLGCDGKIGDAGRARQETPVDGGATHALADAAITTGTDAALDACLPEPGDASLPLDAGADASVATDSAVPPLPPPPPAVIFVPEGRGFSSAFTLTLSPGEAGAEVHCTVDGTLPSAASPLCADPLPISATTLVRAIAVKDGNASVLVQHVYLELGADVKTFTSNLPVIVVHLLGASAPDPSSHEYVSAVIAVFDPASGRTKLATTATQTGRLGIKVRGRSTRYLDKHSYTAELWGADQEDVKRPLLGMPADGDWVLYAPYTYDRSLLRNAFVYSLSNQIGRYAARTRFCELFVVTGGSAVTQAAYVGVYVLMERMTRGKSRIDVAKLEPTDITLPGVSGGYIFERDEPDGPNETFHGAGQDFVFADPNPTVVTAEQSAYIGGQMDALARALAASNGVDPTTQQSYTDLIDSNAFIDNHILNVLPKNPDAFALSAYFHKDRDAKIAAGPVWDFDLSMGGIDPWGNRSVDPSSWGPTPSDTMFERGFYGALFTHPEFVSAYWKRWNTLLAGPFKATKFDATLDGFAAQLTEAEARNRARWPEAGPRNDSYKEEVDAVKSWLHDRLTFIAANKGVLP